MVKESRSRVWLPVGAIIGVAAGASIVLSAATSATAVSTVRGQAAAAVAEFQTAGHGAGTAAPAAHGLSQKAVEIGHVLGFPITNSMVVTWMVALGLIV